MSALVVGGDHLGKIPSELEKAGFSKIHHLSGRKKGHLMMDIPQNIDVVIVLVDFVNHALVGLIKTKIRESGKRAIFARRGWSSISLALSRLS